MGSLKKLAVVGFLFMIPAALFALQSSYADSILNELKLIKTTHGKDSNYYREAIELIDRNKKEVLFENSSIIGELHQLKPILDEKKYYNLFWEFYNSHFSLDSVPNEALIKFGKDFIDKNKAGCSPECKKVFLEILRETRIPYRNSSHIYEGIEYYTNLCNYFVERNDRDAATIAYSVLSSFYYRIGLFAKAEYYLLKSVSFLDDNPANDTLYELLGTSGKSNRYLILANLMEDENKPQSAEKYQRLAINEFNKLRSPLLYLDAPYLFLQMASIKTELKSDSSTYYYDKAFDLLSLYHGAPLEYAWYYIEKGKALLSKNEDDSAAYYFSKAKFLKDDQHLGITSIYGELIPNYYTATLALKQNKPQEAIQLLQPEIQELKAITANVSLINELQLLAKAYAAAGMYKDGFDAQTELLGIKEKLARDAEEAKSLNFAIEKKMQDNENNIALLMAQDEAGKKTKYYLYGILALLGLFAVTLGIAIVNKQRSNTRLTTKNTEVVNTLEQLKQTQSQLIQSEKMASLGELTAGIAHEIQNPLNFVNNFSEVNKEMLEELKAERLKPNAERDDALQDELINDVIDNSEKINHHGKRADAIVKGMLQHSRQSSGKKEPTDINALADEYLRLSYHGLRAKDKTFNAEMKTDFDGSIGKINVIPQDIGRVLLNLFNNAFYAVSERQKAEGGKLNAERHYQPSVFVTTMKCDDKVQIIVKDNGNGIPQKIVDKIFQPFLLQSQQEKEPDWV
jgi:signal transduction histidine kinase